MGSRCAIGDEHVRHSTTTRHIPSQTPHGECPACAYSRASLTIKCSALCGSGASGAGAWRCDAAMETRHAIRAASPCRSRSKSILPGSVHTNPASRHRARLLDSWIRLRGVSGSTRRSISLTGDMALLASACSRAGLGRRHRHRPLAPSRPITSRRFGSCLFP